MNYSDLFDAFGSYKGREAELEVSSADIWFNALTPDQYTRDHLEEATFVCSEHAYRVRNFDNDDIDDVLMVNDTGIINTTDTAMDDDEDEEPPALISKDEISNHDFDSYDDDDDDARACTFKVQTLDYDKLRPLFGWMPTKTVKKTFETTIQYARMPNGTILKKHYKSPFPALNVKRRDEPVATDTVFSDTPTIDGGETCAQIFMGAETLVTGVYGMKTEKQFVNTLEDNIRERGAMSRLFSDLAQVEISAHVVGILRTLHIGQRQSEAHQQHQNPSERRYQALKTTTNTLLDRSGSPPYTWLLCLMYVAFLLNITFSWASGGIPLQFSEGSTQDISALLRFYWWETVYFKVNHAPFRSNSREECGHFVGISPNDGHDMTYKIICDKSLTILHGSNFRSAARFPKGNHQRCIETGSRRY
jgi:hypothetical protein